jgi:hypothetical protein
LLFAVQGLGMRGEAEVEFKKGLAIDPRSYELLANLGILFLDRYAHI